MLSIRFMSTGSSEEKNEKKISETWYCSSFFFFLKRGRGNKTCRIALGIYNDLMKLFLFMRNESYWIMHRELIIYRAWKKKFGLRWLGNILCARCVHIRVTGNNLLNTFKQRYREFILKNWTTRNY